MRFIVSACVVAAVLWSGYWFVGSSSLKAATEAWLEDRRSEGWQADWSDISVLGFPNRFDMTIDDLALADPATGVAWNLPFFQILALSYKPHQVITVWPERQTISTPEQTYELTTVDMRGSLFLGAEPSLPLDRGTFVVEGPVLRAPDSLTEADELRFAVKSAEDMPLTYDLGVEMTNLRLPPKLRQSLDPAKLQPEVFDTFRIDATLGFDRPWDRFAIEERRPQPTSVDLHEARATWGELELLAAGDLSVDPSGIPTGSITVKARNWREILAIVERSQLLPSAVIPLVERSLETLAGLSGQSSSLDIPLTFRDGSVLIGFIPLGPAPRIFLR